LPGEHVRAVEFTVDHAIENDFPVGLWLERDIQPFVFEVALFIRDGERRHVGEFDEPEFELFFLRSFSGGDRVGDGKQTADDTGADSESHY
jgi:hypothetical protein